VIAACALSVVDTTINYHHFTTSLPENGEYDIGIGIGITSGEGHPRRGTPGAPH